MLEKKIESIIDTLTERTISRRESITLKEIVTADIPRGVKVYVRAEVIYWLKADLASGRRYSRINRSAPGVRQLIDAFLRSLSNAYEFTRTDYLTILDDAVQFVVNYLSRPRWTLENFVFERTSKVQVDEVLTRLEYTVDYAYFKRLIETLIRQWGWREVTVHDFRLLVSRVDNQIVRQHSARELALLTKPIYDFLALGEATLSSALPLEPILMFFGDKRMEALRKQIENVTTERGRSELTLSELIVLIEDIAAKEPASLESATAPDEEVSTPPGSSHAPLSLREVDIARAAAEPPSPPAAESSRTLPTPGPPAMPAGFADLKSVIPSKKKHRFIRKIFHKDSARYNTVIGDLNAMASWKDAAAYLTEFYRANDIDPFTEDVVEFTDLIQSRFTSAETQ